MAFLHLSLGRQKATLCTFSGDGSGRLGHLLSWNPVGAWLFRMHAERCPSGPVNSIQPRPKLPPKLPFHLRPLHGLARFFNGFEAACQVMSGNCVGLSSSFFKASESDVRHFFGGWFWQVGPPLELDSCWGLAVSHACRTMPLGAFKFNPTEAEAATEAAILSPSTPWFCTVF